MRRIFAMALCLCLAGVAPGTSAFAQSSGPIDLRKPPPPPPGVLIESLPMPIRVPDVFLMEPPEYIPVLPAYVEIPSGTSVDVVLDTPLSTRISKTGNRVMFRTSSGLPMEGGLELPPETAIVGSVVEVQKPGSFGKSGVLRVRVDHIELTSGARASLAGRIHSQDLDARGRTPSDNTRAANLVDLAMWTLQGTMVGANIKGGKGAAVGAGAGATIATILMALRKGRDVYLEPGMPFTIVLDRRVELPGEAVYRSQKAYERQNGSFSEAEASRSAIPSTTGARETAKDPDRPILKRRPKK